MRVELEYERIGTATGGRGRLSMQRSCCTRQRHNTVCHSCGAALCYIQGKTKHAWAGPLLKRLAVRASLGCHHGHVYSAIILACRDPASRYLASYLRVASFLTDCALWMVAGGGSSSPMHGVEIDRSPSWTTWRSQILATLCYPQTPGAAGFEDDIQMSQATRELMQVMAPR